MINGSENHQQESSCITKIVNLPAPSREQPIRRFGHHQKVIRLSESTDQNCAATRRIGLLFNFGYNKTDFHSKGRKIYYMQLLCVCSKTVAVLHYVRET